MKLTEFAEAAAIFAKYDDPKDGAVGVKMNRNGGVEVSIDANAEVSAEDMATLSKLGWDHEIIDEPSFKMQYFTHSDLNFDW